MHKQKGGGWYSTSDPSSRSHRIYAWNRTSESGLGHALPERHHKTGTSYFRWDPDGSGHFSLHRYPSRIREFGVTRRYGHWTGPKTETPGHRNRQPSLRAHVAQLRFEGRSDDRASLSSHRGREWAGDSGTEWQLLFALAQGQRNE